VVCANLLITNDTSTRVDFPLPAHPGRLTPSKAVRPDKSVRQVGPARGARMPLDVGLAGLGPFVAASV